MRNAGRRCGGAASSHSSVWTPTIPSISTPISSRRTNSASCSYATIARRGRRPSALWRSSGPATGRALVDPHRPRGPLLAPRVRRALPRHHCLEPRGGRSGDRRPCRPRTARPLAGAAPGAARRARPARAARPDGRAPRPGDRDPAVDGSVRGGVVLDGPVRRRPGLPAALGARIEVKAADLDAHEVRINGLRQLDGAAIRSRLP